VVTAGLTQNFSDAVACLHAVIYTGGAAWIEGTNEERLIDRGSIDCVTVATVNVSRRRWRQSTGHE
jgi:hypothetical protein